MVGYDVFISYNPQADQAFTLALLPTLRRPWFRVRALSNFRDEQLSILPPVSVTRGCSLQLSPTRGHLLDRTLSSVQTENRDKMKPPNSRVSASTCNPPRPRCHQQSSTN